MTEKEKANQLVNQFYPLTATFDNSQAKQCAIICVSEIIENLAEINNKESFNIYKYGNYWQQVLKEIEKL